jgi:hypothetical protein
MSMLGDLAHERAPISRGHPIIRLDLFIRVDARLETRLALGIGRGG